MDRSTCFVFCFIKWSQIACRTIYNSWSTYHIAAVELTLLLSRGCVCARRWIALEDGASPTPLYLSSASAGDDTLLEESVQVCSNYCRTEYPFGIYV